MEENKKKEELVLLITSLMEKGELFLSGFGERKEGGKSYSICSMGSVLSGERHGVRMGNEPMEEGQANLDTDIHCFTGCEAERNQFRCPEFTVVNRQTDESRLDAGAECHRHLLLGRFLCSELIIGLFFLSSLLMLSPDWTTASFSHLGGVKTGKHLSGHLCLVVVVVMIIFRCE